MISGKEIAQARDKYFQNEGKGLLEGNAEGQYLKNRVERAFLAGIKAAEDIIDRAALRKLKR